MIMLNLRAKGAAHWAQDADASSETQSEMSNRRSEELSGQSEKSPEESESENGQAQNTVSQDEFDALQVKLSETHDRMLRIAAEADNARKRWEKERDDLRKYAITEFARELLPVIDAFDKAMTLIENTSINSETEEGKSLAAIAEGVGMVSKVFHESIRKHGIERVPGKGEPFNPEYHNAIAKTVDPQVSSETVAEEFVPGYRIGDRILRTAMVKVTTPD